MRLAAPQRHEGRIAWPENHPRALESSRWWDPPARERPALLKRCSSPPARPIVAQNSTSRVEPIGSGLQPSALTRVIYRQHDEGLVFSPNQSEQLLRRVRYDTRQTMQWRNPQTGASLRVTYPAEQVVLTPVSFQ